MSARTASCGVSDFAAFLDFPDVRPPAGLTFGPGEYGQPGARSPLPVRVELSSGLRPRSPKRATRPRGRLAEPLKAPRQALFLRACSEKASAAEVRSKVELGAAVGPGVARRGGKAVEPPVIAAAAAGDCVLDSRVVAALLDRDPRFGGLQLVRVGVIRLAVRPDPPGRP